MLLPVGEESPSLPPELICNSNEWNSGKEGPKGFDDAPASQIVKPVEKPGRSWYL